MRTLGGRLRSAAPQRLRTPPKEADPQYRDPRHAEWAREVVRRAGGRCQWPGCTKAAPAHRMVADHIVELKDGGARFDPANGQCLCVEHNTKKGVEARTARRRA